MTEKLVVNLPDGWHRIPACASETEHQKLGYGATPRISNSSSWYHFVFVKAGVAVSACGHGQSRFPAVGGFEEEYFGNREYLENCITQNGIEKMREMLGAPPDIDWSDTLELQ